MRIRYIIKMLSILTLFFFSVSNTLIATPSSNGKTTLRGMSSALSPAEKGLIKSLSYRQGLKLDEPKKDAYLVSTLNRRLRKAGIEENKDILVLWNSWTPGIWTAGMDEEPDDIKTVKIVPRRAGAPEGDWESKLRLNIAEEFTRDYKDMLVNDIVLSLGFGDGEVRNVSVARSLSHHAFGRIIGWPGKDGGRLIKPQGSDELEYIEDDLKANRVGVRYRIINSAVWIWYHFIYKNKDEKVRQDNRAVSKLLDEFFEVTNNPSRYAGAKDSQERRILRFRTQIPFLLKDGLNQQQQAQAEELQQMVRKIILIINSLRFKIPGTIPQPEGMNLLEVDEDILSGKTASVKSMCNMLKLSYKAKDAEVKFYPEMTRINKLGYTTFINNRNRAFISKDKKLIKADLVVVNGIYFSDDGRFVICAGRNYFEIYNLESADKSVVTQEILGAFGNYGFEFFGKDKVGQYNYIALHRDINLPGEKKGTYPALDIYDLNTGKHLIRKRADRIDYRILGDSRYIEVEYEKVVKGDSKGKARVLKDVTIYDLNRRTYPMLLLYPIITKRESLDEKGISQRHFMEFSPGIVKRVIYGKGDNQLIFDPKTGEVLSPKLIEPSQKVYDGLGPDMPISVMEQITGRTIQSIKHRNYTALYQKRGARDVLDKLWNWTEAWPALSIKNVARLAVNRLYNLTIYDQNEERIIDYDNFFIRKFWFSPDGEVVLAWDRDKSVFLRLIKTAHCTPLGYFEKLESVKFTADGRHLILSGKVIKEGYTYPFNFEKIFNIEDIFTPYPVADFNKETKLFYFGAHKVPGTENIVCGCKGSERITVDRMTGKVVDISISEPLAKTPPQPLDVRYCGEYGNKYQIELWPDRFLVYNLYAGTEIINITHNGSLDYRIIGEGNIVEVTQKYSRSLYSRTLYDLSHPQKPAVKAISPNRIALGSWWYKFDPELVKEIVCLTSHGEDYDEEETPLSLKGGEPIYTPAEVTRVEKEFTHDDFKQIFKHLNPKRCTALYKGPGYYTVNLEGENDTFMQLDVHVSPDAKYIVYLLPGKFAGMRDLERPEHSIHLESFDYIMAEIIGGGRYVVLSGHFLEEERGLRRNIYKYNEKGGFILIARAEKTEDGFSFWFPPQTEEYKGVKRFAAKFKDGRRVWFNHDSGRAMFINSPEHRVNKAEMVSLDGFAKKLKYRDYQTLAKEATVAGSTVTGPEDHYFYVLTKGRIDVAKSFPEAEPDKSLFPLLTAFEEEIVSYKFIGPNSIWLLTINKDAELKVYNLEGDTPNIPIYKSKLKVDKSRSTDISYRVTKSYKVSDDGFRIAVMNSKGFLEVVDLSNLAGPLRKWKFPEPSELDRKDRFKFQEFERDSNYLYLLGFYPELFTPYGWGNCRCNIRTGQLSNAAYSEGALPTIITPERSSTAKSSSAGKDEIGLDFLDGPHTINSKLQILKFDSGEVIGTVRIDILPKKPRPANSPSHIHRTNQHIRSAA